jgi:hypothetical protein
MVRSRGWSMPVPAVLVRELGDFSLHPQDRPFGRPPAAAVLGRQTIGLVSHNVSVARRTK